MGSDNPDFFAVDFWNNDDLAEKKNTAWVVLSVSRWKLDVL